jgi:hypothetical protein
VSFQYHSGKHVNIFGASGAGASAECRVKAAHAQGNTAFQGKIGSSAECTACKGEHRQIVGRFCE